MPETLRQPFNSQEEHWEGIKEDSKLLQNRQLLEKQGGVLSENREKKKEGGKN